MAAHRRLPHLLAAEGRLNAVEAPPVAGDVVVDVEAQLRQLVSEGACFEPLLILYSTIHSFIPTDNNTDLYTSV